MSNSINIPMYVEKQYDKKRKRWKYTMLMNSPFNAPIISNMKKLYSVHTYDIQWSAYKNNGEATCNLVAYY